MKRCPKCKTEKRESEFARSRQNWDGLDGWCKLCRKLNPGNRKPRPYKPKLKVEWQTFVWKPMDREYGYLEQTTVKELAALQGKKVRVTVTEIVEAQ